LDAHTGLNSLTFDSAAGAISLAADGAADDLTIAVTGNQDASLILTAAGSGTDAMTIQTVTNGGGMAITADGGAASDMVLTCTSGSLKLDSGEAAVDSMTLNSAGGIDISAVDDVDFTLTSGGAGEDLTIKQAGANDSSLFLTAEGTGVDALGLSSAGGIDIASSGASDDIDITATGGKVIITGNENAAGAVQLLTSGGGGTSETIVMTNDQGTGTDSINIDSTAGGLDVDVALSLALGSSEATVDAIQIQASAGGIDIDAVDDINIQITSGAGGEDLLLTQVGGNDSSITLTAAGTGADAIGLQASAGGIDIDGTNSTLAITITADGAGDDLTLTTVGAQDASIILTSAGTGADAISLQMDGTGGGLSVDTDDGAISIVADGAANGDITIDAEDKITLVSTDADGTDSIYLHANGGTSEVIKIHSDQGTGAASVNVLSDVGGVTVNAAGANGAGVFIVNSALCLNTSPVSFGAVDVTPDVSGNSFFLTDGTAQTLTDFDAGAGSLTVGQIIVIESTDATVFDTTASGLKGSSVNLTTADGDITMWIYNGTDWLLLQFTDVSVDNSGGA